MGGIGSQAQRFCGSSDADRIEIGAFNQYPRGTVLDFRVQSAHHAADGHRLLAVTDHEHVGGQGPLLAVQGGEFFTIRGRADNDAVFGQVIEIEGVERLAGLHHQRNW